MRYIHIERDEIIKLRKQGYTMDEIASIFFCSRSKVTRVLAGNDKKPDHEANCPICGEQYTYPGKVIKKTCGNRECVLAYNRILEKKRQKKGAPEGPIREYTETSNILIVKDLEKGLSIKQMAKLYNRDPEDLKRHIKKIIEDGTAGRIKRMLSLYQKYNILPQRSGLL